MAENDKSKAAPEGEDKPKIIVDDDWKAQAQAEKEKLAEQVEPVGGQAGQGAPGARRGRPGELPPASFSTLISSLAAQVMLALGGMVDRQTQQRVMDLGLAKHHIDTLVMLEEKTQGHLTDEEKKLLDQVLFETRMRYVDIAQRVG